MKAQPFATDFSVPAPDFSGRSCVELGNDVEDGGNEESAMQGIAGAAGRFKRLIWSAMIML